MSLVAAYITKCREKTRAIVEALEAIALGPAIALRPCSGWCMARPLRTEYPGALYDVTCRGNARGKVFLVDPDRELFLDILA
jgi:hypothetical protein